MIAFLLGAGTVWLAAEVVTAGPRISSVKATPFHTVLTRGIHFRGRWNGRLYALEVWREHG